MSSASNVLPIAEYFRSNPQAQLVFDAIARSQTISGWALAKETSLDPDALQSLLSDLQSRGVINSDGPGLDAFFYVTGLGFKYGSFVS